MFRNWGFLLGEIWGLLLLAGLLGLFAGWLIWSRREVNVAGNTNADAGRLAALQADLRSRDQKIASLQGDLDNCGKKVSGLESDLADCRANLIENKEPEAPIRLDGPRGGIADDLKRISGIGPQMESLCNKLGFYHFDQIASWNDAEIAWVDQNLEGFQGRVVRDNWVEQARLLASGEETEFSKRVDSGNVPSSRS